MNPVTPAPTASTQPEVSWPRVYGGVRPDTPVLSSKSWNSDTSLWQAPEHLRLKEGAQVVLLANLDLRKGLCNGSRGRVVGFAERDAELLRSCKGAAEVEGWCGAHQRLPVVRFGARGDFLIDVFDFHGEEVRRRQLPLALGWNSCSVSPAARGEPRTCLGT